MRQPSVTGFGLMPPRKADIPGLVVVVIAKPTIARGLHYGRFHAEDGSE